MQVGEILRSFPEGDGFQLLREQVLAHASGQSLEPWAASSIHLTYDERTLAPEDVLSAVQAAFTAACEMQREVFECCREIARALTARDSVTAARGLVQLGDAFERHRRAGAARACFEKALELSPLSEGCRAHLLALRRLGRLARSRGDLEEGFEHYRAAYELALGSGEAGECSAAATGLGNLELDRGSWEQAESRYRTARVHAEQARDEVQMGQLLNNLSIVRRRMGDPAGAVGFSTRAIQTFEALDDRTELSRCFNNLGLAQSDQRRYARALESFERAVALATGPEVVAAVRGNLCELHQRQRQYHLAERQARLAEEIALRHGFSLILIHVYRLLGTLARLREDPGGETFFEKALEVAGWYPYLHAQAEVHFEYGLFAEALHDREGAARQFQKALGLYRHLETSADVARAEAKLTALGDPPGAAS